MSFSLLPIFFSSHVPSPRTSSSSSSFSIFSSSLGKVFFGWYLSVQFFSQAMFIVHFRCALWIKKIVYEFWGFVSFCCCFCWIQILKIDCNGSIYPEIQYRLNANTLTRTDTHTHTPCVPPPAHSRSIFSESLCCEWVGLCVCVVRVCLLHSLDGYKSRPVEQCSKSYEIPRTFLFALSLSLFLPQVSQNMLCLNVNTMRT